MSTNSAIEWTDATWNPVTGCTKVSPGCANCYIERTPPFRIGHRQFDEKGTTGVLLHPERLDQPLHWRKPRRVFVNSLSDLFHESVPDKFRDEIWFTMAKAKQHIFQVLTKRPQAMVDYLERFIWTTVPFIAQWPLPNVWLGVSVENQHFADERIPLLLQTPAAVRFISAEPLLGPVDIVRWLPVWVKTYGPMKTPTLDWIICGGESGPGARPMHPDWARSLRDQCVAAGVKYFFKQWGEFAPTWKPEDDFIEKCRKAVNWKEWPDGSWMCGYGKKLNGRNLDGREWNEFPQ